jgi:hypothetical protein
MMPTPDRTHIGKLSTQPPSGKTQTTTALLYQQFGDVLIPLEKVRQAYFRNRSPERFRRALREQRIPLPIVTLDDSHKGQGFICLHHLAALIESRALDAIQHQCDDNIANILRFGAIHHEKEASNG